MSTLNDFVPLRLVLPGWPTSLLTIPALIDQIGLADYVPYAVGEGSLTASGTLQILAEIEADLPAIPGLSFALLSGGDYTEIDFDFEYVDEGFSLTLRNLAAALRVQSSLFKRMQPTADGFEEAPVDPVTGLPQPVEIVLTAADVSVLSSGDVTVSFAGDAPALTISPFMIGDTGVVVEVSRLALILSAESAATLPPPLTSDRRGVYIEEAAIHLPSGLNGILPNDVLLQELFIGAGGFCGTLTGSWPADPDAPFDAQASDVLGFQFRTTSVQIEFQQNALVAASIRGYLQVPFFDEPAQVELGLTQDGGFTLGLDMPAGVLSLDKPGLATITLTGVSLTPDGAGFALGLTGSLRPLMLDLDWPALDLSGLSIGADGTIRLADGWLDLQSPVALDLYGFMLEISRIGFGNTDDGRRWIGLSAGVHLVDFLPTGVSVEGLRITWDPTGAGLPEISLQGVGLELTLPGVLTLDGDVAFINEETERYFKGNVKLALLSLGITLDASLKVGRNLVDDYKFVYTFMDLTLPVGLPLWATGAALYGFSGLYGINVNPSAQNGDWYGWYAGPPAPMNITHTDKWVGLADGLAIGAGLTLGTLFDLGRVVSVKGLLVLVLPGPVIMLHGKANFLQLPPDNDDPSSSGVLDALAVLDGQAGSLQLSVDAGWSQGQVLEIAASADAYFDFANPRNWHFYLGQDQPEDRRIRATALSLLHGDAYLMIDSAGIATGAGISWGYDWTFGPVKVVLRAWIGAQAAIAWQPPQLEGSLNLGGEFEISVAGFGAGLSAEARLSGKAPTLYWVRGELRVSVKLPWPLKDLEEEIVLEWREEATPPSEDAFKSISVEHPKVDETWPGLAAGLQSALPGAADYAPGPIVPLDARPSIAFDRGMHDLSGGGFVSVDAYSGSTAIGDHQFDYELLEVVLEKWPKAGATHWMKVDDLYGAWMAVEDGQGEPAFTRLQLWAKSPFAFTRQTSRTYRDAFLANHANWPCVPPPEVVTHCVDWETVTPGKKFGPTFEHQGLYFSLVLSDAAEVVTTGDDGACDSARALRIEDGNLISLWIVFPEPVHAVELCIDGTYLAARAYANGVLVSSEFNPPPGTLGFQASGIDSIALWTSDNCKLARICYQTEAEVTAYTQTFEHNLSVFQGLQRWSSSDEILEPETWYRLTVREQTARTHNGDRALTPFTHYAYFQTTAAPGLTPAWALSPADAATLAAKPGFPLSGRLTDLAAYVDWLIPADGAAPVYRAYDLGAEFNEDYVEQMLGADLAIRLTDANAQPVLDPEGNEIVFPNQWAEQPTAELSETEYPYTARVEECLSIPISYAINQKVAFANGVLLDEDFSTDLAQWTDPHPEAGGGWAVAEGRLLYDNTVIPVLGALLIAGESTWSDYALEVTLSDQGGEVGLVWRYTNAEVESYYRLRLTAVGRFLERVVSGTIDILWADGVAYAPAAGLTLAVYSQATRLRGQLGDALLFDVDDPAALLNGQVGIYANATAAFERFLVRVWPGAVLAPQTQYRAELQASSVMLAGGLTPTGWIDPAYAWVQLARVNAQIVALGRDVWTDYRLEVNAAAVGRQIGAIVRFQQDEVAGTFTCYRLLINLNQQSVHLSRLAGTVDGGAYELGPDGATELWSCSGSTCAVDFELDTHAIALTCSGATLILELDGAEIARVDDPGGLSNGRAGLYYLGTDDPLYSDLVVRTAPCTAVRSWSFVTSRYAGLVDHLDAFNGQVGVEIVAGVDLDQMAPIMTAAAEAIDGATATLANARAQLAGAGAADVAGLRDAAQAAAAALAAASSTHFEAIRAVLLGSSYRPLPESLELTTLQVDRPLALLLESPEPLDWRRINWQLSKLDVVASDYRPVVGARLVASDDGARALVFRSDGSSLAVGEYELQLTLALDIGLEAPVLRRGGSTVPEVARLVFALA